jgi:hypothetical protein
MQPLVALLLVTRNQKLQNFVEIISAPPDSSLQPQQKKSKNEEKITNRQRFLPHVNHKK